MLPLLPFAAGLVAGAIAVRLLRNEKTRDGLDKVQEKARLGLEKAQESLRGATISGLSAVESSSAAMKRRLSAGKAAEGVEEHAAAPRKAPRKKPAAAARKPAAKPAAAKKTAEGGS